MDKGPIPRGNEIREMRPPTNRKFVAGSRRHIGVNEWIWAPFGRLISLLKYYEKVQLVGH